MNQHTMEDYSDEIEEKGINIEKNELECEYYDEGDCTYGTEEREYSPKCEDVQKIGRCHIIKTWDYPM